MASKSERRQRQAETHRRAHRRHGDLSHLTNRLARHFSGGTITGGSSFGAQCERLRIMGFAGRPCPTCDGTGARLLTEGDLARRQRQIDRCQTAGDLAQLRGAMVRGSDCGTCRGTGFLEGSKVTGERRPFHVTKRCAACRGTGEVMDEDLEDVCQACGGSMYVVPVTCNETGSSKSGRVPPRTSGDDEGDPNAREYSTLGSWREVRTEDNSPSYDGEAETLEAGEMERVVGRLDTASAQVLRAYLGPDGDRWGPTRYGRAFAVWPLTKAGAALARRAAERSSLGHGHLLRPLDLLATEREAEARGNPSDMVRRRLISQADTAARLLVEAAFQALRKVSKP